VLFCTPLQFLDQGERLVDSKIFLTTGLHSEKPLFLTEILELVPVSTHTEQRLKGAGIIVALPMIGRSRFVITIFESQFLETSFLYKPQVKVPQGEFRGWQK
jgi:hypothetical protein